MDEETIQSSKGSLIQAGLTADQATMYEALVASGPLPASKIARKSAISRTLGYKVLGELQTLGLVEKTDEPGKIALFTAAHPLTLKEIADKRLEQARDAKIALEGTLSRLISTFNTVSGSPGIRILEGVSGIAELYEDILNESQQLLLMRSYLDDTRPELASMVEHQIHEQVRTGIHTRALTPPETEPEEVWRKRDEALLVERRVLSKDTFSIPSQIIMYANKVAITAYEGALITTIIENPAINKTFVTLFDCLWAFAAAPQPTTPAEG
jgi:sugar-specific transcriptional regulator TrmB